MSNILLIGASSAIAQAVARQFAAAGHTLFLVARDAQKLADSAADLGVRGASRVEFHAMDITDYSGHEVLLTQAFSSLGTVDVALIAHGTLPDQLACERSVEKTRFELETNALSTIALLTRLAQRFEEQRTGSIAVISSVAGDRGRKSNYVYGTAKAAVTVFLSGLRNRLSNKGVHVMTIKPGFVNTPMTRDFKKGFLWAEPDQIARGIVRALDKRKDIVYLPWFWRYIMFLIIHIPERFFKKLSL